VYGDALRSELDRLVVDPRDRLLEEVCHNE
jgi:hypothetical protein